jgi:tRNA modification GTPase
MSSGNATIVSLRPGRRYTLNVLLPHDDTICALATPAGIGGIAVIRISGPRAFHIVDKVLNGSRPCSSFPGYSMHRANINDGGEVVDDVIISIFHSPKSFTGEDVVEVSCHGGAVPVSKILSLLINAGCRAAGPGEFTQRGFLNGKMDLAQAEAVCDLINARTEEAYRQAVFQRAGVLSKAVESVRDNLLGILARIEAAIDFSEDVGELDVRSCIKDLDVAVAGLSKLIATADRGILLREGARVVLVGRPNAGKSSLMNALLRHDRAIVTEIPGTTRDTLEESLNVKGILVRLWDTAGLRDTLDLIESFGIERSRLAIETADLVILVVDSVVGLTDDDRALIDGIRSERLLVAWNKCDLSLRGDLRISAKLGAGIDQLEDEIANKLTGGKENERQDEPVVTHIHQKRAIERALDRLADARATAEENMPADFLSVDVRGALNALGEVTGQGATDDIINEIFSRFCIGK